MILVFDASAAGKPKNWSAPAHETFNWPRLVHLAWILYDEEEGKAMRQNHVIKPENFEIPEKSAEIHGVHHEFARENGHPLEKMLDGFNQHIQKADIAVAHNTGFNEKVVAAEYYRNNEDNPFPWIETYCLMREATYVTKIEDKQGRYRWPSLLELHEFLFDKPYPSPGRADTDVAATFRCLIQLVKNNSIDIF